MTQIVEGKPRGEGVRIAVVVSRFNEPVTEKLLEGAEACLDHHGCTEERRTIVKVPGAWEIPLASRRLLDHGRYDAVIALGALIRGETAHFEYLATEVARGLGQLGMERGIPVIFGVLTTYDGDQARARAKQDDRSNKGWEAAVTALEMIDLYGLLEKG